MEKYSPLRGSLEPPVNIKATPNETIKVVIDYKATVKFHQKIDEGGRAITRLCLNCSIRRKQFLVV